MTQGTDVTQSSSLTRRQLYGLVWSIPMRKLAGSFGWSDVWLAKLCRQFGVPTPQRGYWAKKRAGKRANRRRLPRRLDPDEVVFTPNDAGPEFQVQDQRVTEPVLDADVVAKLAELDAVERVGLAEPGAPLHRLVVTTGRRAGRDVPVRMPPGGPWRPLLYKPGPAAPFGLDVSEQLRDRALRILDAVVRGFEAAGFKVVVPRGDGHRRARIDVLDQSYGLSIDEPNKQRPYDPKRDSDGRSSYYHPKIVVERSGRLTLHLVGHGLAPGRSWSDTPRRRIEAVLDQVVRTEVKHVHAARRAAIAAVEREEKMRKEKELRRLEEQERWQREMQRQREQERIDALMKEAGRHDRAQQIVAMVRVVRERLASEPDIDPDGAVAWIEWAEDVASGLNPVDDIVERLRESTANPSADPRREGAIDGDPLW